MTKNIQVPSLQTFDFVITKAVVDQGVMKWSAVTSDTNADLYDDEMTDGLYDSFLEKIENNVDAPEELQSDFWKGGMPYLSLGHYSDQNGSAVPGTPSTVFQQNEKLRANGIFFDNGLGINSFKSIQKSKAEGNPVKISIGFYDQKHEHKSDGSIFERKFLGQDCPQCKSEIEEGKWGGRKFLDGQLVHFALTKVPVNQRTIIMEEKSMTTRKEDVAQIVGDKLAEEIDEREKEILKANSKSLVTKSDGTENIEKMVQKAVSEATKEIISSLEKKNMPENPIEKTSLTPIEQYEDAIKSGNVEQVNKALKLLADVASKSLGASEDSPVKDNSPKEETSPGLSAEQIQEMITKAVSTAMSNYKETKPENQVSSTVQRSQGTIQIPIVVSDPNTNQNNNKKKVSRNSQIINRSVFLPEDFDQRENVRFVN